MDRSRERRGLCPDGAALEFPEQRRQRRPPQLRSRNSECSRFPPAAIKLLFFVLFFSGFTSGHLPNRLQHGFLPLTAYETPFSFHSAGTRGHGLFLGCRGPGPETETGRRATA